MRISDWSSDVCSSDLRRCAGRALSVADVAQAAGCAFLASSRFRRRARSDSLPSEVFSSQLSRPPTCSTERSPLVETRSRTERPRLSDIGVTFCRLGRKVRLVLLFAWDT